MDQTVVSILQKQVNICVSGFVCRDRLSYSSGSNDPRFGRYIMRWVLTINNMWAVMLPLIANLVLHQCRVPNSLLVILSGILILPFLGSQVSGR